jgi:hypothetical protein
MPPDENVQRITVTGARGYGERVVGLAVASRPRHRRESSRQTTILVNVINVFGMLRGSNGTFKSLMVASK